MMGGTQEARDEKKRRLEEDKPKKERTGENYERRKTRKTEKTKRLRQKQVRPRLSRAARPNSRSLETELTFSSWLTRPSSCTSLAHMHPLSISCPFCAEGGKNKTWMEKDFAPIRGEPARMACGAGSALWSWLQHLGSAHEGRIQEDAIWAQLTSLGDEAETFIIDEFVNTKKSGRWRRQGGRGAHRADARSASRCQAQCWCRGKGGKIGGRPDQSFLLAQGYPELLLGQVQASLRR